MTVFSQLVKGARDYACSLYKEQPSALIPNPGETALRFLWDAVCPLPDYEPPPPPSRDFEGGQCDRVGYIVTIEFQRPDKKVVENHQVYGRVYGAGFTQYPSGNMEYWIDCHGFVRNGYDVSRKREVIVNYFFLSNPYIKILGVSRIDGLPDNCGSPPLKYPGPSEVPPGGFTSSPVPITYNDGTDINVNFNVQPVVLPPPGKLLPPVTVNIKGPFADINLCFSLTGDVAICGGGDGGGDIEDLTNKFDDFKDDWDDFKEDWDFDFDPPDFDTDPNINKDNKEPDKEGGEDGIEGLVGVKLVLTTFPSDAQFGSPTVYFAGWLTFKLQNGYIERTPINFESGYFPAPPGANGYAYTLVKGAEGEVTVYTKMPEEEE